MAATLLALNAGSSSLKFAAFESGGPGAPTPVLRGEASGLGDRAELAVRDAEGAILETRRWPACAARDEITLQTLQWLGRRLGERVRSVGHRIVHGGPDLGAPVMLDADVLARLEALIPWAPLHQPAALAIVRQAQSVWPGAAQVACFDTAFHHSQPAVACRLGLPRELEAEGLRRYGFHGLSCQSAMGRLSRLDPDLAGRRVLIAHLGAGSSITAVQAGRSLDSSMGFSPLDGLLMSTRCGSLDPGVILFLEQTRGMEARQVEDLLYHRSGLLGVSGLSGDMRVLLASQDEAARQAVELFVFRAAREAGALIGSMQGLDGVIFTGGIGENAPAIRSAISERLQWLGLELEAAANTAAGDRRISAPGSRIRAWVLAADEEAVIAEACARIAGAGKR